MTREEAIKILADLTDNLFLHTWEEQYKALHMAIEALQAKTDGDLISRADAIEAMGEEPPIWQDTAEEWAERNAWVLHVSALEALPSAVCDDCIWHVCNYNKVDWDKPSAETEWIPISEGLPKEHEWVGTKQFGTTISDKVHITFDVNGERFVKTLSLQNGELSNYEKRTMDTLYKGWKMIAWMPLPKPYREDGGGE